VPIKVVPSIRPYVRNNQTTVGFMNTCQHIPVLLTSDYSNRQCPLRTACVFARQSEQAGKTTTVEFSVGNSQLIHTRQISHSAKYATTVRLRTQFLIRLKSLSERPVKQELDLLHKIGLKLLSRQISISELRTKFRWNPSRSFKWETYRRTVILDLPVMYLHHVLRLQKAVKTRQFNSKTCQSTGVRTTPLSQIKLLKIQLLKTLSILCSLRPDRISASDSIQSDVPRAEQNAQLVKKSSACYGIRRPITVFTRALHLIHVPVECWRSSRSLGFFTNKVKYWRQDSKCIFLVHWSTAL
jgi:hypothetical protein